VKTYRIRFPRIPRAGSARSAGRWVGLGASALVTATGLLVTPVAASIASADNCPDAEVVFARGTNEPSGLGRVGDAFVDSLRQQTGGLNIATYGVNYAASKLQLHGGDGANDAITHVKQTVSSCPNTKIVLGGYSQGASVIDIVAGVPIGGINWGSSLPPELANNVAAVVTFGDVADRAGGSLPTQSAMFGSRSIDLCNPNDPICHAGPGNEWSGHTEGYVPVYTSQAAAFVASRLLAGTGQQVPGYGPSIPAYGPQSPGFGPQNPGYGPQNPGYGPQNPGYGPQNPGYGPQNPGYGPQTPGSGPSIHGDVPAPDTPSPQAPLV
jgi:cutinase